MKFYVPYYDRNWNVKEIDTERTLAGMKMFRVLPHSPGYPKHFEYCGTVFNGENCFKTEVAAWAWINKQYVSKEYRVEV